MTPTRFYSNYFEAMPTSRIAEAHRNWEDDGSFIDHFFAQFWRKPHCEARAVRISSRQFRNLPSRKLPKHP